MIDQVIGQMNVESLKKILEIEIEKDIEIEIEENQEDQEEEEVGVQHLLEIEDKTEEQVIMIEKNLDKLLKGIIKSSKSDRSSRNSSNDSRSSSKSSQ